MSLNLAGTAVRNFGVGKDTKISPKIRSNEDFVVGDSLYQGEKTKIYRFKRNKGCPYRNSLYYIKKFSSYFLRCTRCHP
mgnify:CR=1 FL=1